MSTCVTIFQIYMAFVAKRITIEEELEHRKLKVHESRQRYNEAINNANELLGTDDRNKSYYLRFIGILQKICNYCSKG